MMSMTNGMDGMMGGAGGALAWVLMMALPTLLGLALLVLAVPGIVWPVPERGSGTRAGDRCGLGEPAAGGRLLRRRRRQPGALLGAGPGTGARGAGTSDPPRRGAPLLRARRLASPPRSHAPALRRRHLLAASG